MHIHFSNLNEDTTRADINTLLAAYPSKGNCAICYVKNNISKELDTFALVDMADATEMAHAINLFNGYLLGGRKILLQTGA